MEARRFGFALPKIGRGNVCPTGIVGKIVKNLQVFLDFAFIQVRKLMSLMPLDVAPVVASLRL
jgi:hypothetical protein